MSPADHDFREAPDVAPSDCPSGDWSLIQPSNLQMQQPGRRPPLVNSTLLRPPPRS